MTYKFKFSHEKVFPSGKLRRGTEYHTSAASAEKHRVDMGKRDFTCSDVELCDEDECSPVYGVI